MGTDWRKRYILLQKATENLCDALHASEVQGVEFSKQVDDAWALVTDTIQETDCTVRRRNFD